MKKLTSLFLFLFLISPLSCNKKESPLPTTTLIINPETQSSEKIEEKKTEVKMEPTPESEKKNGHWDKAGHEMKEGFKSTGHEIKKGSEKAGAAIRDVFK